MISNCDTKKGTLFGYVALIFWACSALLASSVTRIPTFEVLSVAFSVSFGATAIVLTIKKKWHQVRQPLTLWVIGMVGVYGNDALFVAAFKYAPAAHVDLINYLWPIIVILLAGLLPKEKLSPKHLMGALLGLCGAALIILHKTGLHAHYPHYMYGYLLALFDAIVWSIYTIAARYYKAVPSTMIGMYCGCGLVLSLFAHFSFEHTVVPHLNELLIMIVFGLTSQGSAYYLWDYGVKNGNFKLLSVLSYLNPVISIALLIAYGKSQYSNVIIVATLLIASGGALCGLNLTTWKHYMQRLWSKLVRMGAKEGGRAAS
ncbi:MAG: EamA family transporter [Gammaproteobacteria bacterium]|nr:EamA family transporter [Gammaproteobacteria bacterium]MCH9744555.1 EamA family transporter [Gammaproteobacteria bacterium]